jgi:hypothetical protein
MPFITFLNVCPMARLTETYLPSCWLVFFSELFHSHSYSYPQLVIGIQKESKWIASIEKCAKDSDDKMRDRLDSASFEWWLIHLHPPNVPCYFHFNSFISIGRRVQVSFIGCIHTGSIKHSMPCCLNNCRVIGWW